ncbi:MAG: glycosyltransferase [Candidatus Woesearchaeota archaeon]
MKLLIATDSYLPRWDGISRFLTETVPFLEKDFEVHIIAPALGMISDEKITRVSLSPWSAGDYSFAKFAWFTLGRAMRGSNVVFTQSIGPIGGLAIIRAKLMRIPVVAYIHSIEYDLASKAVELPVMKRWAKAFVLWLSKRLYRMCSLLIVPSEGVQEILDMHNLSTRKTIISLGVDAEKFVPGTNAKLRESLGIAKDAFVIGYHGRLSREKDLLTLLRAYARLERSGLNVRLLIVGDGIKSLKKTLEKRGAICVGSQDDVLPYLHVMDAYALTSLTETTSLTTLEAMACGLPVVATEVGLVKEYVNDGKNGFLIKPKDTYKLFLHLKELAENKKLRADIGDAARKSVMRGWNWKTTAQKLKQELEGVAKK